jgi:ribosomal protein S18 acetylase RimI-like enzyme
VRRGEAEYLAARSSDGMPIGKCGIDYVEVPNAGMIHQLAIRDDLRGRGIGTRLIAAAEERIRAHGLSVAVVGVEDDNPRARALYERLGYGGYRTRRASWEAERADGTLYVHETVLTDLRKVLSH